MLLEGVRVLDLSNNRPPGTLCTHLLADMGMDVIKVEAPGGGGHAASDDDRVRAFDSENRNKKSIVLNLKLAAAKDAFYRLVETADAIVESYRPGVAGRLGIDFETVHARNPQLVYCSISGYGQNGPYAQFGLHDTEASAARGAFYQADDRVITPSMFGVLLADTAGALHAALAVVGGLLARAETGQGSYVDIALADCVSTFNLGALQQHLLGRTPSSPAHLERASLQCKDGKFLVQSNTEPENWKRFCGVIGRPDLVGLPRADAASRARGTAEIRQIMLSRSRDEWVRAITDAGASAAPCQGPAEIVGDPQVLERGLVWEVAHPTAGRVQQWGAPINFADHPAVLRNFAPRSGGDTAAILGELGYSAAEIEGIRGESPQPE